MVGGKLLLWKMMEFVSWDDDIPNWMEKYKMFQTTNHLNMVFIVGFNEI